MKRKNSLIILVAVLSLCCFNKVWAEVLFQSDFENSTASTTAWPDDPNDHDPNIPTVGSWSIDEDWDEGVQVSSYTGGGQPTSAASGSNYLISGWHGQAYPSWDHKGLATAEFTPVSQAIVDFWVYSFEGQYGRVHGRDLHGTNERAFELVFWTDSSPTTEVKYDGTVLTAQMTKDAWNHIVVELDLINDTAGVTVNDQATEYFTTLITTDLLDTLLFRDEYTGYYDDIQVDSAVFEPETTLAWDDFESNTTASTAAWPDSSGDYDPDAPAAGTWSIDEDWDEGVQVSSYTGGGQPASAYSGSNYLISGWHGQAYPSWDHKGLATIEFTPVSQAIVDFWVYSFEGQYGTVHGRDLQGVNDKAFELVFWTDSSPTTEVQYDGTVLTAQMTKDAWNHIVVELDLINDTAGVTVNDQATEYFTTLATTDLLDTLLFRDEYTGYYDDILVTILPPPDPVIEVFFQDDFENSTTASTAAWPDSSGDYDPDAPAAGTWTIDEDWDEGVQVSSYTGGGQPTSAASGSNYLISGWHGQDYPSWDHKGLATAEFTPVSQAVVDFWVYSFEGQYGTVHGRDLQGVNDKAFELVFWTDSSPTTEVQYDGTVLTAQMTKDAWNHVVVDLDLINDTAGVTINSQATEYFTTLATTDLLDTLLFRDEYTGYYDDITVSISEPTVEPMLVSYYSFDGTLEDTVGPYDGTIMPSGGPSYIAGPYALGQALLLDGSQYVDIGYGQPKGEVMRNGSVSLWFNMSADPVQYKMLFGTFNDGVSEGIWAGVTTDNLIDFEIRNGAGQNVTWDNNRPNISSDTWYFYTATWGINSQTGNLDVTEYLDGVLTRSGVQSDLGAVSWQYPMALGAGNSRGSVEDFFIGALDDIKFYNYPLSAAEIQQEYVNATGIPVCLDPPVADFTGDCKVNLDDLARLAAEWLLDGNLYPN